MALLTEVLHGVFHIMAFNISPTISTRDRGQAQVTLCLQRVKPFTKNNVFHTSRYPSPFPAFYPVVPQRKRPRQVKFYTDPKSLHGPLHEFPQIVSSFLMKLYNPSPPVITLGHFSFQVIT